MEEAPREPGPYLESEAGPYLESEAGPYGYRHPPLTQRSLDAGAYGGAFSDAFGESPLDIGRSFEHSKDIGRSFEGYGDGRPPLSARSGTHAGGVPHAGLSAARVEQRLARCAPRPPPPPPAPLSRFSLRTFPPRSSHVSPTKLPRSSLLAPHASASARPCRADAGAGAAAQAAGALAALQRPPRRGLPRPHRPTRRPSY